ncbi:DivIVA domain-containing protein [Micromonospora sp. NPDC049679]|uniref:DivIVA domain-containing protein n=1 Tax=Micromonospora sp. NPDC049679 TaxID=3155920 RepID=UPI0033F3F6FC
MTEYGEPIRRGSTRLGPDQVRRARFEPPARRRAGLDAEQVYAFLAMVADELGLLHRDIANVQAENDLIKKGLRAWQTRHAGCGVAEPRWPGTPVTKPFIGRAPGPDPRPRGRGREA